MQSKPSIEFPITSESEFHSALCDLITNATANDISPEGAWSHRCSDDEHPDLDIEISRVTKPVDD